REQGGREKPPVHRGRLRQQSAGRTELSVTDGRADASRSTVSAAPTGLHNTRGGCYLSFTSRCPPRPSVPVPTVVVAPSLTRWLTAAPTAAGTRSVVVAGSTVREVLDGLFAEYPTLRGYATDERGALRHHVVAFVDG